MARAERESFDYLFRLRMTANVRRSMQRAMLDNLDWRDAGQGSQGNKTSLRLVGVEPPSPDCPVAPQAEPSIWRWTANDHEQQLLSFVELGPDNKLWEYAALVTSLDGEILTIGHFIRDRADCENAFDELKNQWGWGGCATHDLARCRLSLAGIVALIFNWWSLFVRLADLDHRPEAITRRPLLMQTIARQTQHAGQVTLTIASTHAARDKARRAYRRIAGFLARLRQTAEQLASVATMVSHSQRSVATLPERATTRAAATLAPLEALALVVPAATPARNSKPTAGFRIK